MVLGCLGWCRLVLGGGESPPPFMDLPRRGAAAVAAGGTGRVTVPVGVHLGGPFGVDGADMVLGRGGVAPGGRRGIGVERPGAGAAIPCAGAASARGVVARWGRVVGSCSGGGGGGGAHGGALVAVALVVVVMVLQI